MIIFQNIVKISLTFIVVAMVVLAGLAQAVVPTPTGINPATSGTAVDLVVSLGVANVSCMEGDIDGNCIVNILDLALFVGQWLEVRDPFVESDGLVVMEAEHYLTNSEGSDRMWVAKDITGSIGDGCVQALPDLGTSIDSDIETTSPHLTYEIEFATTGTYYLWVRGMADNTAGDSVHYGVDGVAVSSGAGDSIQVNLASFAWSNGSGASINISSAGTHTLDIWMREDGIIIDRLLLTTDFGYTPVQPEESASVTELIADLDGIDGVNMSDYAIISENWQDSFTPVIINEFMASNANTINDEDGESSDWIEIYNHSEVTVDMTGWYLTDEATELNKWQFTAGPVLAPGEYAIIFASGKSDPSHPMHTNFQLQADGEYLGLCLPDQSVAYEYSLEYPPQIVDISYGLFGSQLQYFANPTPGLPNQSGYFGIVPDTKFSIDRGFYDTSFSVAITCDDPSAVIRYTTDSEEPTDVSGTVYSGPISISGTTVLRAIASRPGWISSNVDTQTYIFVSDVKTQSSTEAPGTNWPNAGFAPGVICNDGTLCGVMQYMSYGMDPDIINNPTYSGQIEGALLSIPSISISTNSDNLFDENTGIYVNAYGDGLEWERPASMELIYPDGTTGFQIDMGLRIRGAYSRMGNNPKHAFRCFFRSQYGDSKLIYPLFGEEGVDEFDKIDLRAEQNYSWGFCNDARSTFSHEVFTRDTQAAMGQPYTRSRYYHLYLNGHYWGLFQTQERSEARYAESYFGGEVDDYDVVKAGDDYAIDYTDGDLEAYGRLYNAAVVTGFASNADYFDAQGMNPDGTENPSYEKLLDIDNVIAYNLMCYYFGGIDYPIGLKTDTALMVNNLYGIYNRNNPDGWKFFIHDAEHTFGLREGSGGADRTRFLDFVGEGGGLSNFNPVWLHQELFDNVEYRIAFADAVHKHLFNDGALSEDKCFDRLFERLAQVEPAIVAESARWGDALNPYLSVWHCGSIGSDSTIPLTKSNWDSAIVRMTNFMIGRTNTVFNWIKNRTELHYPSIDPPVLYINAAAQHGGYISVGDTLTMTNPNGGGTIYYTLDGSDPRLIGGGINPAASIAGGSTTEVINETTHVKARVISGSEWSALSDAVYADDRVAGSIRISEVMYHPADPNTEFVELKNIGTDPVNLNVVKFTKGIDFTFGDQTLAVGQHTVVVQDMAAFQTRYPTVASGDIAGQYAGRLDNDEDRIEFQDAAGTIIQNFKYEDNWYELTDGAGFSLTMVDPASSDPSDWDTKSGWRSSLYAGGTPADGPETTLAADSIVFNELLAHSNGSDPDWIELHNTTGQQINISGWFLSDDDSDPNMMRKYQIPDSTNISAGGYYVFVQDVSFGNPVPVGSDIPFGLSEGGETVYLYSGQGGEVTGLYQTQQKFDASETGVTFGRYEKAELSGGYDFARMTMPTPGNPNPAAPLISEIVITEIYYNPPSGIDYEFVKLYNRTGSPVTLEETVTTETSPGIFVTEDIPWRLEGTGYEFPASTTIPAHSYILVAKVPANYSSALGPYDGKLDNGGEEIEIQIPGDQEFGKDRYWIPIEKIDYDDVAPWPTSADGGGDSLHRIDINTYGRDYSNWNAATPSP